MNLQVVAANFIEKYPSLTQSPSWCYPTPEAQSGARFGDPQHYSPNPFQVDSGTIGIYILVERWQICHDIYDIKLANV